MKFRTLSTMVVSVLSLTAFNAQAEQFAEQPTPNPFIATDSVEVNGQTFQKITPESTNNLQEKVSLHVGDEVVKNTFGNVAKATGLIFVTVNNEADAKSVAKDLGLEVVFSKGESAVFKAGAEQNLLTISDHLNADSRIKAQKIELNSSKFKAQ